MVDSAIGIVAASTVAIVAVFDGARRMRQGGVHRPAVLCLLAGLAIGATVGAIHYLAYRTVVLTLEGIQPGTLAKDPPIPKPELPDETREGMNQIFGQMKYGETGKLHIYAGKDGQAKTFAPSESRIAAREERVASTAELRAIGNQRFNLALTIWLGCGVAFVAGLAWPRD